MVLSILPPSMVLCKSRVSNRLDAQLLRSVTFSLTKRHVVALFIALTQEVVRHSSRRNHLGRVDSLLILHKSCRAKVQLVAVATKEIKSIFYQGLIYVKHQAPYISHGQGLQEICLLEVEFHLLHIDDAEPVVDNGDGDPGKKVSCMMRNNVAGRPCGVVVILEPSTRRKSTSEQYAEPYAR